MDGSRGWTVASGILRFLLKAAAAALGMLPALAVGFMVLVFVAPGGGGLFRTDSVAKFVIDGAAYIGALATPVLAAIGSWRSFAKPFTAGVAFLLAAALCHFLLDPAALRAMPGSGGFRGFTIMLLGAASLDFLACFLQPPAPRPVSLKAPDRPPVEGIAPDLLPTTNRIQRALAPLAARLDTLLRDIPTGRKIACALGLLGCVYWLIAFQPEATRGTPNLGMLLGVSVLSAVGGIGALFIPRLGAWLMLACVPLVWIIASGGIIRAGLLGGSSGLSFQYIFVVVGTAGVGAVLAFLASGNRAPGVPSRAPDRLP